MKIPSLIRTLLLTNESFSITGLGKFTTKQIPAQIKQSSGEIIPPTKKVSFDPDAKQNDSVISNALINQGLTAEEASIEIAKFVDEVKNAIKNNSTYKIEDLGYFYKDKDDKIRFMYTSKKSLSPDALGFETVFVENKTKKPQKSKTTKIKKTKKEKPQKQKSTKKSTQKQQSTKIPTLPKVNTKKKTKSKEKSKKLFKTTLISIIIIIIVTVIGIFYKPILDFGKKFINTNADTTNQIIQTTKQNRTNLDTNNNTNNKLQSELGNDTEYKKLLDENIKNMANVYLGSNYKKFYLIVGSFRQKQNAQQYANQIRNLGITPFILDGEQHQYYRVSIGSYNKADKLIKAYKQFGSKYGKEIWILVNKK